MKDDRPPRNLGHSDGVIIARAVENGWRQQLVRDRQVMSGFVGWVKDLGGGIPFVDDDPAVSMRARFDHDDRCGECGQWIEYDVRDHRDPVLRMGPFEFCWGCRFWLDRIRAAAKNPDGHLVAVTTLGYASMEPAPTFLGLGSQTRPRPGNGFGGWFVVEYLDGRPPVESCDLWCGGRIPERFLDRLPVTATVRFGRLVAP